eukprot:GHVU01167633.1.p1 GENE.GHVU01167633.1~~GHVU01167633.1.p1  ORF type:complete len:329 (-),score=84.26 GHVU01167633.1:23-1009(-)
MTAWCLEVLLGDAGERCPLPRTLIEACRTELRVHVKLERARVGGPDRPTRPTTVVPTATTTASGGEPPVVDAHPRGADAAIADPGSDGMEDVGSEEVIMTGRRDPLMMMKMKTEEEEEDLDLDSCHILDDSGIAVRVEVDPRVGFEDEKANVCEEYEYLAQLCATHMCSSSSPSSSSSFPTPSTTNQQPPNSHSEGGPSNVVLANDGSQRRRLLSPPRADDDDDTLAAAVPPSSASLKDHQSSSSIIATTTTTTTTAGGGCGGGVSPSVVVPKAVVRFREGEGATAVSTQRLLFAAVIEDLRTIRLVLPRLSYAEIMVRVRELHNGCE